MLAEASTPEQLLIDCGDDLTHQCGLFDATIASYTDASGVGTRKAMPVSAPFIPGMTLPQAAPTDDENLS